MNVYQDCPKIENDKIIVRLLEAKDEADLFLVYSDPKAVNFFNSDNCNDNFYYDTIAKMHGAMSFWLEAYKCGYFVRLSVVDKETDKVVGTYEVYYRESNDSFNDSCFVRLDLRSDYEREAFIYECLSLCKESFVKFFDTKKLVTKSFGNDTARYQALKKLGFIDSKGSLITNDGKKFDSYMELIVNSEE